MVETGSVGGGGCRLGAVGRGCGWVFEVGWGVGRMWDRGVQMEAPTTGARAHDGTHYTGTPHGPRPAPHLFGIVTSLGVVFSASLRMRMRYCVILVNRCLFLWTRNLGQ